MCHIYWYIDPPFVPDGFRVANDRILDCTLGESLSNDTIGYRENSPVAPLS